MLTRWQKRKLSWRAHYSGTDAATEDESNNSLPQQEPPKRRRRIRRRNRKEEERSSSPMIDAETTVVDAETPPTSTSTTSSTTTDRVQKEESETAAESAEAVSSPPSTTTTTTLTTTTTTTTQYWLLKSEPHEFSIDDLQKKKRQAWDGIRNNQAVKNLQRMRINDLCLFYHSGVKTPAVVGIAKVVKESYPDPSAFDPESKYYDPKSNRDLPPKWFMVGTERSKALSKEVTLKELDHYYHNSSSSSSDNIKVFEAFLKQKRLSVHAFTRLEYETVLRLAQEEHATAVNE